VNLGRFHVYLYDQYENSAGSSTYLSDGVTGTISYTPEVGGTYYVRVHPIEEAYGTYDLAVYNAWYNAGASDGSRGYSGTFATAKYIAAGNYAIAEYGDEYYRFTAQAGVALSVSLTPHVNLGRFHMYLYDQYGNSLGSRSYISDGVTGSITYTPVIGGTYYIRVAPIEGAYGSYDIGISASVEADGDSDGDGLFDAAEYYHETNPENVDTDGDGSSDLAEIAAGFDPLFGGLQLTCVDDVGGSTSTVTAYGLPFFDAEFNAGCCSTDTWYVFDLAAGQGVTVTLTPHVNLGRFHVYLYDQYENSAGSSTYLSDGVTGTISYTPEVGGTYYIRVHPIEEAYGTYDLAVYNAWFNDGTTDCDRNYYSTRYTSRFILDGNYDISSSKCEYYRLWGTSAEEFSVSVSPHVNLGRMHMYLYDQTGVSIASARYIINGSSGTITYTPEVDGTYYIGVFGIESAYGNYDLSVTDLDDSDKDAMLDEWEMFYFCTISRDGTGDWDIDGLTDKQEHDLATHPKDTDTENDGMPDGWEVANNLDPLVNDTAQDPDDDDLNNLAEYLHNTDPQNPDTEDDGMPDGWEVSNSLNPIVDDASGDPDGDNLDNVSEYTNGTDPHDSDTDADNMTDGWEVSYNLDPIVDDAFEDLDGDGFCNWREYLADKKPNDDSDIPSIATIYADSDNNTGQEDGSSDHPFNTIQEALDFSGPGDTVYALAGRYVENVLIDKDISLIGDSTDSTIIDGSTGNSLPPVRCLTMTVGKIEGFLIINGTGSGVKCDQASMTISGNIISGNDNGIYVGAGSVVTIENNIIKENTFAGITVTGEGATARVLNNTIFSNDGNGIEASIDSTLLIQNNIIVSNGEYGISSDQSVLETMYNNLWNNLVANYNGCSAGIGDISADPLFVDLSGSDYHLSEGSPCIDAALSDDAPETDFDGRVRYDDPDTEPDIGTGECTYYDIGAYEYYLICECDLNHDGSCNVFDWFMFIEDWGRTDCTGDCECDLNHDGSCNVFDWFIFIEDWGRTDCPVN